MLFPPLEEVEAGSIFGDDSEAFDTEDEFHAFSQRQFARPDFGDDVPSHPWDASVASGLRLIPALTTSRIGLSA